MEQRIALIDGQRQERTRDRGYPNSGRCGIAGAGDPVPARYRRGTPIWGDEKYGGLEDLPEGMDRKLHLHARRIIFPHPREGTVDITAPVPDHMLRTFGLFGFDASRFEEGEQ